MKKTLLFSNTIGDISIRNNEKIKFNDYMEDYLIKNVNNNAKLVFINAPGLGNEDNYLENIIKCFNNINIKFQEIFDVEYDSNKNELDSFLSDNKNVIYFLMGGNPLTQMEIIKKYNLCNKIKNHPGLVIGFCAGAINLSKYSIITTDEDFDVAQSYNGLRRVEIIIEPHYNRNNDEKRNNELIEFTKKYNQLIYAIPDGSIIVVEDNIITEYGCIYHINNN